MSDAYFREILGIGPGATREQIRQAYRTRVMENHPDRFPPERKALQELAVVTLTEAYSAMMSAVRSAPGAHPQPRAARPTDAARAHETAHETVSRSDAPAIARHKDPAYAYYKQGFINFSLAIHGIAEINRKIAAGRVPRFTRRYTASEDIAGSLAFLRAAHGYFTRVVDDHPDSVWSADSRAKLRRIERFTSIYRKILANLSRAWPPGVVPDSE
jgi:hypothetical protein